MSAGAGGTGEQTGEQRASRVVSALFDPRAHERRERQKHTHTTRGSVRVGESAGCATRLANERGLVPPASALSCPLAPTVYSLDRSVPFR